MKKFFSLSLKIILLTILYFVLFMLGSALLGPKVHSDPSMRMAALAAIPIVALVNTLVLALVILRSSWSGWRLMLVTSICFYGVQTFMGQIETAYFGPALGIPASMLPGLFMSSLPIVLIFIPVAVLVLGKGRSAEQDPRAGQRLSMPAGQWAWKAAAIALLYAGLYFAFGYFVAWQNPHLVAMYNNGSDPYIFNNTRLFFLQLGRGVLWMLFSLPVIRMSKGNAWQVGLLVGLLLALPMNIAHVIPNPIMPDPSVRLSHFIETATSNFIFGNLLTLLVLWRPARSAQALPAAEKARA